MTLSKGVAVVAVGVTETVTVSVTKVGGGDPLIVDVETLVIEVVSAEVLVVVLFVTMEVAVVMLLMVV